MEPEQQADLDSKEFSLLLHVNINIARNKEKKTENEVGYVYLQNGFEVIILFYYMTAVIIFQNFSHQLLLIKKEKKRFMKTKEKCRKKTVEKMKM